MPANPKGFKLKPFGLGAHKWLVVRLAILALAVIALGGLVGALLAPAYSAEYPQGLNLFYLENVDTGKALMIPSALPEQMTADLLSLFKNQSTLLYPWSTTPRLAIDTPLAGVPAPELRVTADKSDSQGREVTVVLSSPRGTTQIDLMAPVEALTAVTIGSQTFQVDPADAWNGMYYLSCYGLTCDGLKVTLRFTRPGPVSVYLFDYSPGLPAGSDAFIQARSPAIPVYDGDQTMLWRKIDF